MGAPAIPPIFAQRVVVGVGDLGVSNHSIITLSTYALGSCVAVAVYDPVAHAAGLLHFMLPDSAISPAKASSQPAVFADTGLPLLFRQFNGLHAELGRSRILLAGGANVMSDSDTFRIGERNIRAATAYLARANLPIDYSSVAGTTNRTVHLNVATGQLTLKCGGNTEVFQLGD